jgi:YHS domain-containing protein
MELTILGADAANVQAGYQCPCGCSPSVTYARGGELVEEGCCCGNLFAVGPDASASLPPREGFHPELKTFQAPWGESLEAAWSVGASVHGPDHGHDDHGDHDHQHSDHDDGRQSDAIDPVCGMTVDRAAARTKGLHTTYQGVDYFFCGKGCKLEFGDDPERFLAPDHVPSM